MAVNKKLIISMIGALIIGSCIAVWFWPQYQVWKSLQQIVSADPAIRNKGWKWFSAPDHSGQSRARMLMPNIFEALEGSDDEAFLDANLSLRNLHIWNWTSAPHKLLVRDIELRVHSSVAEDHQLALNLAATCPKGASDIPVARSLQELVKPKVDSSIGLKALELGLRLFGMDNASELCTQAQMIRDEDIVTIGLLGASWIDRDVDQPGFASTYWENLHCAEALLLSVARNRGLSDREDMVVINAKLNEVKDRDSIPLAYILRYSEDPKALKRINELADAGDELAKRVRQAMNPSREHEVLRRLAANSDQPVHLRRLAAWRLGEWSEVNALALLEESPVNPDGSVYAAVLLADRLLSKGAASELAEKWIRSFEDDFKRTGALLAALLDEHIDLLAEAYLAEDVAVVKTTQRNALFAAGRNVGNENPLEFAFRTLHIDDAKMNEVNPDTLLCLLIAGDKDSLVHLTSQPDLDNASSSVQYREWMIERFVPLWYERAGRPIGGNKRALKLHFESLRVLRLLTQRSLEFDTDLKLYSKITD